MEAMAIRTSSTRSVAGALSVLGGLVLIGQAVAATLTDQNTSYRGSTGDVLADALLGAGLLLVLPGLQRLGATLPTRLGTLAVVGQAAIVVAIAATIAAGREALDIVYVVGAAALIVGSTGLAITSLRSRVAGWRPAIGLPIATVAALALTDAGGAVLLGLLWLLLGSDLTRRAAD